MTQPLDGVKKTRGRKIIKKDQETGFEKAEKKGGSEDKKKKSFGGFFVTALATALIIGAGMYAWHNMIAEDIKSEGEIKLKNTERPLNDKIGELQSKLNELMEEKKSFENEKQNLESMIKGFSDAQKEFSAKVLGVTFYYPATYGASEFSAGKGESGKIYKAVFAANDKFLLGGISKDFKASTTAATGTTNFLYTQGFKKDKDKYFYLGEQGKELEIEPVKALNVGGTEILIVNDNSFVADRGKDLCSENPGKDSLGAIINLKSGEYSGMAIWSKDTKDLTIEKLEKMLQTLKFN